MTDQIEDVVIVGGGDIGLITGLAVKRQNPGVDVTVVDDFRRDIPQVGKSTFLEIRQILHGALGIDERRFVKEVKPVWKATVFFRDWCDYPPFHFPFDAGSKFPGEYAPNSAADYYYWYDEEYRDPESRSICEAIVDEEVSPWYYDPQTDEYDRYDRVAYHLNTERFNGFLRELCAERDVDLVNDEIVDVAASGSWIDAVESDSDRYQADLYVDASGFNRVVKESLESEFVEFPLPLDSAFNTRIDRDLDDVVPATVVESGDYGWFWQIDTYDNRDLGYVFASEYVDDEQALTEFVEHVDGDVDRDDVARYGFTSGYYDEAWEGNCVTIGNAEGFVEPLQSTGLTINAKAAVKLGSLLSAHNRIQDDDIRETYNTWVRSNWESIGDFIGVHYVYAGGDTEFWQDVLTMDLGERVEHLERAFDRHGIDRGVDPTSQADHVDELDVFSHMDFYLIMRNMSAQSLFYENNDFTVPRALKQKKAEMNEETINRVESHLTTSEMYRTVIDH